MQAPGTIYRNGRRYWWMVTLPGQPRKAVPLIPVGGRFATTDHAVAKVLALELWRKVLRVAPSAGVVTVPVLVARYQEYLAGRFRS